ncbi:hypothetical protein BDW59DRAFT_16411 [Aspergillus cavernicola]|uniref:Uncharacterized protein n=1 Tax=Aspergillus cavernicola TaxID=176166 RepID=A0ABR4HJ96_9EURO
MHPPPMTCQGSGASLATPPRSVLQTVDQTQSMTLIPKFAPRCADAKYYIVLATAPSNPAYDGLLRAIADSGNDILIGDYCEVADAHTLKVLQRTGAAAVAFLSGAFPAWAFDNMMASMLHFRAVGYYRDRAREHMPPGIYGRCMTGLLVHRYLDITLFVAVAAASVAVAEVISEEQIHSSWRPACL